MSIDYVLTFRPKDSWQASDRKQKLLIAGLIVTLTLGLFQITAIGITHSQSDFFKHFGLASIAGTTKPKPITKKTAPVMIPSFMEELPAKASDSQLLARGLSAKKFGDQHWYALRSLWNVESGWNPEARNSSSGACGLPQALPCQKIPDLSLEGQIDWGLNYIAKRYGNPSNAWSFWQSHHWY